MKRVVNSLLQFIEDDRSESLIVAATNHEHALDAAIFRRFDEVIAFGPPTKAELTLLVSRAISEIGEDLEGLNFDTIYAAVANAKLGHADVCAALRRVRKDHVLLEVLIDTATIIEALVRRIRGTGAPS